MPIIDEIGLYNFSSFILKILFFGTENGSKFFKLWTDQNSDCNQSGYVMVSGLITDCFHLSVQISYTAILPHLPRQY